jgi:hypothetical protein
MKRHWINPWKEARDLPLDSILELASKYYNCSDSEARLFLLKSMCLQYPHLDAYIIPSNNGWHSLGARYGNEEHEYLSFTVDYGPELENLLKMSTSPEET